MKDLIERLLSDKGKLSLLLIESKEYADKSGDEVFIKFIENEMNGYKNDAVPDYRIINGELVATVQNSFGQITHKQFPIDFSNISKDLSQIKMSDGISFIESSLANLKGPIGLKPLPIPMVNILNEVFNSNNPDFHLVSVSHRFGIAAMEFILNKVRQELILGLKRINSFEKSDFNEISTFEPINDSKKVFVTYAWENEKHNDKVISFVDFLRKNGYEASMDRKESQEQTSININQMMVEGLNKSNKVIVVLSPQYKEKADNSIGGAGFEFSIIMEQLKKSNNKYVFVSFGQETFNDITPIAVAGREIIDLKKDQDDNEFNNLFAKLDSRVTIVFSEVNEDKVIVKTKEIEPFKL